MKITIKHRSQNQIFIWILILGPFLLATFTQLMHLHGSIKYLLDFTWLFLLIIMAFKQKRKLDHDSVFLKRWIIIFVTYTFVNYLFHYQSFFYYLWGFRNNFRGYIFFMAVIYYLSNEDIKEVLNIFDKLFYINAFVMLIQFWVLGYKQDNLGGIFGVESGCNGYLNLFLCIMLAIYYIDYYENRKNLAQIVMPIVLMLVLAAMAELKFFYIEFIIIVVAGSLITTFSWKKLIVIIAAVVALYYGYRFFFIVFPNIDLSIEGLIEYASSNKGYTSSGDLNRMSFMSTINKRYLKNPLDWILGMGLGNCDYATGVDILSSPFYYANENMHYGWMSTSFTYLENGLIGLIFFFGFFIIISFKSLHMIRNGEVERRFCLIACLCGTIAVMNGFYNISLRIESCYMMYFILAIPWCCSSHGELYLDYGLRE